MERIAEMVHIKARALKQQRSNAGLSLKAASEKLAIHPRALLILEVCDSWGLPSLVEKVAWAYGDNYNERCEIYEAIIIKDDYS